jgi:ribosomal protein S27AE
MIRYVCRNCGYVLAEIRATYNRKHKHWSTKTIVHCLSGDRVYNGSLTPQEVIQVLGDFCPRCGHIFSVEKYILVIKSTGLERRREIP